MMVPYDRQSNEKSGHLKRGFLERKTLGGQWGAG